MVTPLTFNHDVPGSNLSHDAGYLISLRFLSNKRHIPLPSQYAPSSSEVKNSWSYTFNPQYVFMAWCLIKHRGNFTFTFIDAILI
jgi:hypothetical protein